MTTETGGPAFPCHPGIENPIYDGMTLRDYFASKVIQGICANPDDIHVPEDETYDQYVDEISRSAYKIADAMLEARRA